MLSTVRDWFSRGEEAAPELAALCFVAIADDPLRERFGAMLGEHKLRVERFANIEAMLLNAVQNPPNLVVLDVAFGVQPATDAMMQLAGLPKKPAVQLVSAVEVKNYEQLCAVGQAKFAGERAGLKTLAAMQPPHRPDVLRKTLQDLGLLRKAGKATVSLADALKNDWLELWYQPKIDLAAKRLVGAEGLIRVRHPELGVLPPGAFLPGASDQDMLKMTEQVIMTALRDFGECAEHGAPVKFSVNTPVSALTTLPIADMLREGRPKSANWPGLILEVTEDEIVNDLAIANEIAKEVQAHGASLALDDFGAGYSSFARLRQLPFSELKIDRSYVTDCNTDRTNAGLCETIVEMAKRFGLKTVAEGIETPHESHKLQGLGCDVGQGYLFAKPMSKDDFVSLMRRRIVHKSEPADQPRKLAPLRFNAKA
jgi:EAL domain-containing protein (putative c-di-GMP-specific phosphodiesterase class I)